jgi:competence protein ComEC
MLAVWLLARASSRSCGPLTTLSLALILVVLLDPFAPLASGFWLSFGAIAAILFVTHGRVAPSTRVREAIRVQLAVSLGLVPVTLACFGCVPITGILVNVVAIPFFSFVLVPLVLLSFIHIAALGGAAWLYMHSWPAFVWAANSPLSLLYAAPSSLWYAGAVVSIVISLLPWPVSIRTACLLWLLPTARAVPDVPGVGGVHMTVLDAGQNTAIVIRTAHRVLFYGDAGQVSEYTLLPYLRSQGVHPEDVRMIRPDAPEASTWHWDGVSFRVHCLIGTNEHPDCVMHITTATSRILLTDRLDAQAERRWVNAGLQPADVVIVPRHGSNIASSSAFIAAVAPQWALITGSMKPAAARWRAGGARVLATADSGAIHVNIDPVTGLLPPVPARQNKFALWRPLP